MDILQSALAEGLNFIDSDWITASGHAQEVLGRALQENTSECLVSTKVGPRLDFSGALKIDNSRGNIINQVHDSLFRLKRDQVDLIQVHWPDDTLPSQTARGLEDACFNGLAKYIGVCNYSKNQIAKLMSKVTVSVAQSPLSILNRSALTEIVNACREFNIGFLASDPLQSGLLQGLFTGDEQFSEADYDAFFNPTVMPRAVMAVQELASFARAMGLTTSQLSVAWCLNQEGVSAVLCPATKDYYELQKAADIKLGSTDFAAIDQILDKYGLIV